MFAVTYHLCLYDTATTAANQVQFIEGYKGSSQSNLLNYLALKGWSQTPAIVKQSVRLLLLEITPQVLSQLSL